jgi:molecular chaperone GrpE
MTDKKKSVKSTSNHDQNDHIFNNRDQQITELREALQRERADSINLRRQYETNLANARTLSLSSAVRELLPAIDSLERSLKHVPDDLKDHDYVKGIQAVLKQFERSFDKLGIKKIPSVGQLFDPRFHEAVHMDDSLNGNREIVSEELQSGYMLGDDVIRHAMVNVKLEN